VLPGYDLSANRWLFMHLTQLLDHRVMALLQRPDGPSPDTAFSLNLHVDSVLSPDFLAFDAAIRLRTSRSITIELAQIDVFADLSKYRFARDTLRDRGYRLCIDGVDAGALPLMDRSRLGYDLIKFRCPANATEAVADDLHAAVTAIGRDRVILTRCDDEAAMQTGLDIGVTMFQGFHLDRIAPLRHVLRVG
jgi:EAL domain-containing protein (putative c-di-GMP-specific phosphodiesterase class I)